jgi:hypothetical protein
MATVKNIKKQLYVSKEVRDDFIRIIKTQKKVSGFETQFYRKDGSQIWASVHARSVLGQEGTLILIEGIMADITEQKRKTPASRCVTTTKPWRITMTAHDFVTDFILGKINLELGTKASMLELALYANNILDCLTQVDLQFPDEMSEDELTTFRSKMETFRHAKGA